MKKDRVLWTVLLAAACVASVPAMAQDQPAGELEAAPTVQMVVTARVKGDRAVPRLGQNDVEVLLKGHPAKIFDWVPLQGPNADIQLVFLIDDSVRSYFSLQIPSLKKFIMALPSSTEVAVGYMDNGRVEYAQTMTADHALAAKSLRLPNEIAGISGSPYFVLSDLAKHWPSKVKPPRRVVFMVTNGEDPYYTSSDLQDPYVAAAISDSQKAGLLVYAIYFRDQGYGGSNSIGTLYGQSYLQEVADSTGGALYTEAMISPVSFDPFLKQFKKSLDHQYLLAVDANGSGLQQVKVKSKARGVKLVAPWEVNVGPLR
ncbi:MAG: vWA domain-containing protein [Acidobacteriaceae bacterium]